jgi:hypothetical protein
MLAGNSGPNFGTCSRTNPNNDLIQNQMSVNGSVNLVVQQSETINNYMDDEQPRLHDNYCKQRTIYTVDCFLSAFLFAPISGLYWFGTWSLMDTYILPNNGFLSGLVCYIAGLVILMPCYVFQESIQAYHDSLGWRARLLMQATHIYVAKLAYVLEWRGFWTLCDKYILLNWKGDIELVLIGLAYMLIARCFRFVCSAPFLLAFDSHSDYTFLARSRYRVLRTSHAQYAFDFIVAELVESFVSIIAWRDLAIIVDRIMYPNNADMNIGLSASIGYAIFFVLATTQSHAYTFVSHHSLIPRLFVQGIYNFLMFLSVVVLWRIYWTLPDTYIRVDGYDLQAYLATHFGSYLFAIVFQASAVVTGFGSESKDGELDANRNYFLISYLTEHFETF